MDEEAVLGMIDITMGVNYTTCGTETGVSNHPGLESFKFSIRDNTSMSLANEHTFEMLNVFQEQEPFICIMEH
jgi:hypothetical protein